jgi:hypothetical protein
LLAHFHPFRTRIAPIALAALLSTLAAEPDLLGHWYGEVSAVAQKLGLVLVRRSPVST